MTPIVTRVALLHSSLLLPLGASDAAATELCGRVTSGDRPVRSATLLAASLGRVTQTDSLGRFCFTDLTGDLHRIQVVALGFTPFERWVDLQTETASIQIELVPLRSLTSELPVTPAGAESDQPPPAVELVPRPADVPPFRQEEFDRDWLAGEEDPRVRGSVASDDLGALWASGRLPTDESDSLRAEAGAWRALRDDLAAYRARFCRESDPEPEGDERLCDLADRMAAYAGVVVVVLLRSEGEPIPPQWIEETESSLEVARARGGESRLAWLDELARALRGAETPE